MRKATNISRKQLLHLGICIGKFTHSNKFHLVITALDVLAPYAKVLTFPFFHILTLISIVCVSGITILYLQYKIWLKPSAEQQYVYGNNILKSGLGRIIRRPRSHITMSEPLVSSREQLNFVLCGYSRNTVL